MEAIQPKIQNYRPLTELVPTHWQSAFYEMSDGVRLHYTRTGGAKPALLLLHGFQNMGLNWLRTAQALEADYDVVMPDFRGHGQSSPSTADFSAAQLTADTAALITALGLDKPVVFGHSMGGEIAGRLAAEHADLVKSIMLVDPPLRAFHLPPIDLDNPPPWLAAIVQAMRDIKSQPHLERLRTGLRLMPPGTPVWGEADFVAFVEAQVQFDLATYGYGSTIDYRLFTPDIARCITCPTLLLTARAMLPEADFTAAVEAFKANLPHMQHIHFRDSGHFIPAEQFDRFIAVTKSFLG